MFILGLLVLAASVVAAVELVLANHAPIDFHMWGWTWHFDAFWLAVIGAIIVTAAWIGLGLMQIAFGHARRIRREHRQLAAENRLLAERATAAETIEPMPVERPVVERHIVERPVASKQMAPDGGQPAPTGEQVAPPGEQPTSAGGAYQPGSSYPPAPAADGTGEDTEHHGFFSRHAMSGRGHRR